MFAPHAQVEAFHLMFLRALVRAVPLGNFSVKGGCNLRFFFDSPRYSEDIDLDVWDLRVYQLQDKVMSILESGNIKTTARTFNIARVRPPDISRSKQTETVQRFKVHLETSSGEDLPTRIEFSRRGGDNTVKVEPVLEKVLGTYRMPPLIVPHYSAGAAARQKIRALLDRKLLQARDIFDLHVLSTQPEVQNLNLGSMFSRKEIDTAAARIYAVEYEQFRDTVVSFLDPDDQKRYDSLEVWDQIRLITVSMVERGLRNA